VSLLPVLKDAKQSFRRPLHWRMNHRGQQAMRDGDWKYLKVDGNEYLFNIPADERERANLGKKEPERLAAMREDWDRVERDDAGDSRGCDGEPGVLGEGHAAALRRLASGLKFVRPISMGSRCRSRAATTQTKPNRQADEHEKRTDRGMRQTSQQFG
jgi:hypothetical protein